MYYHELLPSESPLADSIALLALVWVVNIPAVRLHCSWPNKRVRCDVVPGAERLLLHDNRQGLLDHSSASASDCCPSDTFPNTASNPAAHSAAGATCYTWRTS